jgi:hypothetical protein
MKRFRRWLFSGLAAISLLLVGASAVLYWESLGYCGCVEWNGYAHQLKFDYADGVPTIFLGNDGGLLSPTGVPRIFGWFHWRNLLKQDRASLLIPSFNRWGFGAHSGRSIGPPAGNWRFGGRSWFSLSAPYWSLIICLMVLPGLWIHFYLRRRWRTHTGFCEICGYDLRATPDRCPECGIVPANP